MTESVEYDENLDQATGILGLHVLSGEGAPVAGDPGIGGVVRDELSCRFQAKSRGFAQKSIGRADLECGDLSPLFDLKLQVKKTKR